MQPMMPTTAHNCPQCGTALDPGERFCGNCGQTIAAVTPAVTTMPPPVATAATIPTKKGSGRWIVAALVVVVLLGAGWYAWRSFSYSPPTRQKPDLPQRAAGTMTEFPVDTNANDPARPGSVMTQNFGAEAGTQPAKVPDKWLPPGVEKSSLPKRADAMTSAVYRPRGASTKQPASNQPQTASARDEVYVHVLNSAGNRAGQGEEIATAIQRAINGQRTGIRVNSPDGDTYIGSRLKTAQTTIYVLDKQASSIVVIVYAPTPEAVGIADRLAGNVGNGEGLNDEPDVRDAVWTLPPAAPTDLVLQEVNTLTAAEMEGWLQQGETNSREIQELINQVRQLIPERLTNAHYLDRTQKEWNVVIGDYGSAMRAWTTWSLFRWTAGLAAMRSVTLQNGDGLFAEQDNQAMLIFHRGPYLVVLSSPITGSEARLVAFANTFQV